MVDLVSILSSDVSQVPGEDRTFILRTVVSLLHWDFESLGMHFPGSSRIGRIEI